MNSFGDLFFNCEECNTSTSKEQVREFGNFRHGIDGDGRCVVLQCSGEEICSQMLAPISSYSKVCVYFF